MANVTIPDLTAITTPGATTVIEVADPAATPVSRKMTLANAIINGLEDASLVAFTTASGALSVESSVADGVNAVAFSLDAPALTDSGTNTGAVALEVKRDGIRKMAVSPLGSIEFSDDTVSHPLLTAQTTSATGGFQPFFFISQYDGVGPAGVLTGDVYADYCSFSHGISNTFGGKVSWTCSPTQAYFGVSKTTSKATSIEPTAADGSPVFTVNSEAAHTSGLLTDFKNNGTSKFSIDFAGRMIAPSAPPANASATGVAGSITWDSGFLYVCVATNTWKRVAIATW
jgi:hypothetical protein